MIFSPKENKNGRTVKFLDRLNGDGLKKLEDLCEEATSLENPDEVSILVENILNKYLKENNKKTRHSIRLKKMLEKYMSVLSDLYEEEGRGYEFNEFYRTGVREGLFID